jgi:phosphoglycolate phosphatase
VIFDIDGTLIDSFSAYYSAFNKGIGQYNLEPVSKEFLINCLKRGLSLGEIIQKILPNNLNESIIEKCKEKILELFLKVEGDEVSPFPGINELFRDLKDRGLKIGVATGRMSLPEDEWKRFKRFGLDRFIDTIVTSKEVEKRKPAPDLIVECAKRLNIPIEECLVVGDTEADIIAAKMAGAIPVAVTTGQDSIDLLMKEKPEYVFRNLNDLKIFLEEQENDR